MLGKRFTQTDQKRIIVFLVMYRWTSLLFSMMITLIQQQYDFIWNRKSMFFMILLLYNLLLTFFYREIIKRDITAKLMTIGDTIINVVVVTYTGQLTSPYFFYSLSSVFTHTLLYEIRGAIEGIVAYFISFLVVSLAAGSDKVAFFTSLGNIVFLLIIGIIFTVFCGIPSLLIHQLDRKSQNLEDCKKNLLYLHEIACMMRVNDSNQEMLAKMVKICRKIYHSQKVYIYMMDGQEVNAYGVPGNSEREEIEKLLADYTAGWDNQESGKPVDIGNMIMIPINLGARPQGFIFLKKKTHHEVLQDDIMLFTVIANMIGASLENSRVVQSMKDALLISERKRIARDMHDGLAQSLFFFSAELQNCRKLLGGKDRQSIESKLVGLQRKAADSLREVRTYIYNLRNDNVRQEDLLESIGDYLEKIREDYKLHIQYVPVVRNDISDEIKDSLVRIVQEGINNVVKHANADHVKVFLEIGNEIELRMEDNGQGFNMEEVAKSNHIHPRFGLQSIKERAEALGGYVEIDTKMGEGTRLTVIIPNNKGGRNYAIH